MQPVDLVVPIITPTIATTHWEDASMVMQGICFESALDAAEQVFVLRDEAALIAFYDAADNSQLCRQPVTRNPFDFNGGRLLVGLWSHGQGCTARHEVLGIERDDTNRTISIDLRFITEGDCNYELVRGFWAAFAGVADYQITVSNQ
ncbi:MAG: hypothetical protein K8L97_24490 [Anaerolineae bacterium]|nr:hypothetical protein [Anaerolineae bacterium]